MPEPGIPLPRQSDARADWIARRQAMADQFVDHFGVDYGTAISQAHFAMERVVGQCPPGDPPLWRSEAFYGYGGGAQQLVVTAEAGGVLIRHEQLSVRLVLSPEDADAMGDALHVSARWVRERNMETDSGAENAQ